jgi:hypothetical protein
MGAIFQHVALVIAWLGIAADESYFFLLQVEKLCQWAVSNTVGHLRYGSSQRPLSSSFELGDNDETKFPVSAAIKFFQRSWFQRLFIDRPGIRFSQKRYLHFWHTRYIFSVFPASIYHAPVIEYEPCHQPYRNGHGFKVTEARTPANDHAQWLLRRIRA